VSVSIQRLKEIRALLEQGHAKAAVERCRSTLLSYPDHVDVFALSRLGCLNKTSLLRRRPSIVGAAPRIASPSLLNDLAS